ncbi:MAG: hypothetical protein GX989_00470 [Firmicutes bacterium]|nr:hypothetical protein [Bacillota bacterium]
MGEKRKLRRVFPGSNSARGFFSFFTEIAGPAANRVLVLKGGPGCGKSTFMRKIGATLQENGYDLEYHHCASDSQSLDGLLVPALGVALIDGTSPHVFDAPSPGVIGETIDLGRFVDRPALRENKERIFELQSEVGRLFKQAHRMLAITGVFRESLENCYSMEDVLDRGARDRFTLELLEEILGGKMKEKEGTVRRLFASAITPQGWVHHLDTLLEPQTKVYLFEGASSTEKSRIIERILAASIWRGFHVEAYHCALNPEKIDHLIIPELGTAIVNNFTPHRLVSPLVCRKIDSGEFIAALPPEKQLERDRLLSRFNQVLEEAIGFLARARSVYQELEGHYISRMDFAAADQLCRETTARLLEETHT